MKKQEAQNPSASKTKVPGDEIVDFTSALDSDEEDDLEDVKEEIESSEINDEKGEYSFERDYQAPTYIPVTNSSGNYQVYVNLDSKKMRVESPSGAVVFSSRVSPGKPSTPTPPGDYRILWRVYKVESEKYKVNMYYNHFFTRRKNGNYRDAIHRGSMATGSHGCVRLPDGAAQEFYALTGRVGEDNFSIHIR